MQAKGLRRIGYADIPGGGKVIVCDGYAYVGHLKPPNGTSILDVRDPAHPKLVAELGGLPANTHTHKVEVRGELLFVNVEQLKGTTGPFQGGLKVYDIRDRTRPREMAFYKTGGRGIHRFTLDDQYAYVSTEMEGYRGAITLILDMRDPLRPTEVSRWWLPGQWIAGGEQPTWDGPGYRTHHPIRLAERLYVSLVFGGMATLDISDISRPRLVGRFRWSPSYQNSTHTALPVPFPLANRRWVIAVEEDVTENVWEDPPACVWMVDATDEANPIPVSTYQVPFTGFPTVGRFGAHQPWEGFDGTRLYVTWFSGGLRVLDYADPYRVVEVGHYVPDPAPGQPVVQSNDVWRDERGLLYLLDRHRGLEILEATA